jgi:hypothetical protein
MTRRERKRRKRWRLPKPCVDGCESCSARSHENREWRERCLGRATPQLAYQTQNASRINALAIIADHKPLLLTSRLLLSWLDGWGPCARQWPSEWPSTARGRQSGTRTRTRRARSGTAPPATSPTSTTTVTRKPSRRCRCLRATDPLRFCVWYFTASTVSLPCC